MIVLILKWIAGIFLLLGAAIRGWMQGGGRL